MTTSTETKVLLTFEFVTTVDPEDREEFAKEINFLEFCVFCAFNGRNSPRKPPTLVRIAGSDSRTKEILKKKNFYSDTSITGQGTVLKVRE